MGKKKSGKKVARAPASTADGIPLAPPGGMRDLLPPHAEQRAQLRRLLMQEFLLHGYQRVTTPPFEYADLVERGYDAIDRRDLVRFVLADTGDVAVLRPDITPQIARIVATRLRDRPAPWRICYEGTVIRRRRGRARRQQQVSQVGIELVGLSGPRADAEVIALGARACRAAGLNDFCIELAQTKLGLAALQSVATETRNEVIEQLSRKDVKALSAQLKKTNLHKDQRTQLMKLAELYGGVDVIEQARKTLRSKASRTALDELSRVIDAIGELGFAQEVLVDLGNLRGHAYYTGVSACLLAAGPGEAIGMGGRYDQLLARYGFPEPATGFAIDVDNLEWALGEQKKPAKLKRKASVLLGGASAALCTRRANELREANIGVAITDLKDRSAALQYANAWQLQGVIWLSAKGATVARTRDDSRKNIQNFSASELETIKSWLCS